MQDPGFLNGGGGGGAKDEFMAGVQGPFKDNMEYLQHDYIIHVDMNCL